MKYWLAIFSLIAVSFSVCAQQHYAYYADLEHIENDKINITLRPPGLKGDTVIFSFPRIIPGSYSEKNFGTYIDDFTAKDKNGGKLKVIKLNANQYEIRNAKNLATIAYKVNDTWDTPSRDFIFQPGGTNIDAGKNVVMNNHAFFGYFEGYKKLPFEINVTKPAFMYAATHLQTQHQSATNDVLLAENYFDLVDNPVFYAAPDTSSFIVGSSSIQVAVISARQKVKSTQIAAYLKPLAAALNDFFDGLPVKSYQFLFYFEDPDNIRRKQNSGGFGALEHNYSSLYFLPEIAYEPKLKSLVLEVSSHEFLHILTPLNLHSEEIEEFDFIHPKMSKHLWLYEGVTEYFAQLTQLQHGLQTTKAFFDNMREKINASEKFGEFSLTKMSEHVLEDDYKDKYGSVYSKGAVTAMMLDIFIRNKTAGEKDLKTVITTLAKRYGAGKPFKDDDLFREIVAESQPAVRQFIDDYIIGEKPLPYQQLFALIGYNYSDTKKIDAYYNGKQALKFDETNNAFVFTEVEKRNALDINDGDVLLAINDTPVTSENVELVWEKYFKRNTIYPELTVTVKRDGLKKELTGNLYKGYLQAKNYLEPSDSADNVQLKLRGNLMNN
jgi:predicted metalloprotease with PDZ domain